MKSERAYTVNDIDALREACRERWLWGTTKHAEGSRVSRSYRQEDMDRAVEELVRTYMMAGITADDIYEADAQSLNRT